MQKPMQKKYSKAELRQIAAIRMSALRTLKKYRGIAIPPNKKKKVAGK